MDLFPLMFLFLLVAPPIFVVSNAVCLLFIIKCVRIMFSEEVMQSVLRRPFFHLVWMLSAIGCGIVATYGYRMIWNALSRLPTG